MKEKLFKKIVRYEPLPQEEWKAYFVCLSVSIPIYILIGILVKLIWLWSILSCVLIGVYWLVFLKQKRKVYYKEIKSQ